MQIYQNNAHIITSGKRLVITSKVFYTANIAQSIHVGVLLFYLVTLNTETTEIRKKFKPITHVELLRCYMTIGFRLNIWRKYFLISLRDHLEHVEGSSLPKVYKQEVKSTLPAQWVRDNCCLQQ